MTLFELSTKTRRPVRSISNVSREWVKVQKFGNSHAKVIRRRRISIDWYLDTGIPCRWLSACHWRSSKTTVTNCPPNLQLFGGQNLCSFGHRLTKGRVVILPVQAVAEDILISTVWPRRIVTFSFLTAPYRNIRTYLLIPHTHRSLEALKVHDALVLQHGIPSTWRR